jgi:Kdo2-lipid IVA lauroyltransferase/acyltransferase
MNEKSNQFKKRKKMVKDHHSRTHRIAKAARYFIGLRIIKLLFSLPSFFPLTWALSLSKFIVKIGSPFARAYRRQALENLRLYYGEKKSSSELKKMVEGIGIDATKGAFETIYSASPRKEEVYSNITIEGQEHLDAAINKGKGVIALSAHLGNFAIMRGKLISEGYTFYLVIKLPKDPGISHYFKMKMEQYNLKFILADPTTVSQKEILRTLRRNEIVCLIVDGDQKKGGVPVMLMGQEIAMPPGPAILARRTGATVLPMFIIRQKDNSQKIIIEPPVDVIDDEDQDKTIALLCQKFATIIEPYIKRYPTQWYWINKKHASHHLRGRQKKMSAPRDF